MNMRGTLYMRMLLMGMCLLIFPLVSFAAPPGTIVEGDWIDVSKQTWVEYDPPIVDPLGHPTRPWQPKGEYPWKQPYTGEMLGYMKDDIFLNGGKYTDISGISARLNKRGLMVQRVFYYIREATYDSYNDVIDYDEAGKVGTHDIISKRLLIYETPADVRGTGALKWYRLNSPVDRWIIADSWIYSPSLRRVTRSQGGDRQDEIMGTPVTNDDEGERQIWEEEHILIGEDIQYMVLLDPQWTAPERKHNSGDMKIDGEWFVKYADPSRGQEKMNPYRPDGGIESWVVLHKWLKRTEQPPRGSHVFKDPKEYYLKYQLEWIDKVTKYHSRYEQYDHDNRIIKIGENTPELFPGGFAGGGLFRTQYTSYDLRRHFRSWGSFDDNVVGLAAKHPDDWYTPEHLFKEYFWKRIKVPFYKSQEEFSPPPALYRSKLPKYRAGTQDWLTENDMDYMARMWKNHGFTDEEIEALQLGDGVIRKDGKIIPVRKHHRPAFLHGKPLPVKFPNE